MVLFGKKNNIHERLARPKPKLEDHIIFDLLKEIEMRWKATGKRI
jgi:hypothetical protein